MAYPDMTPEQIASAWALTKPDDEPTQIVCTGEEGSDVWQPAFGTWEADDFGLNSDERVGIGERLFVNRGLYDAMVSALEAERAKVARLVDKVERLRDIMRSNVIEREGPHTVDLPDGTTHSGPVVDFLHSLLSVQIRALDAFLEITT